jgi:uncharacterized protein (DUF2237 family)
MMGSKAARNLWSRSTNKIGIHWFCWFYSQGICHDTGSYDLKMHKCSQILTQVNASATRIISTCLKIKPKAFSIGQKKQLGFDLRTAR